MNDSSFCFYCCCYCCNLWCPEYANVYRDQNDWWEKVWGLYTILCMQKEKKLLHAWGTMRMCTPKHTSLAFHCAFFFFIVPWFALHDIKNTRTQFILTHQMCEAISLVHLSKWKIRHWRWQNRIVVKRGSGTLKMYTFWIRRRGKTKKKVCTIYFYFISFTPTPNINNK